MNVKEIMDNRFEIFREVCKLMDEDNIAVQGAFVEFANKVMDYIECGKPDDRIR